LRSISKNIRKDIAIGFNNLTEEQKMMLRHWLRVTLSDELKDKLSSIIENILDIESLQEVIKSI
jgi:uncharacterized membrane protein YqhA